MSWTAEEAKKELKEKIDNVKTELKDDDEDKIAIKRVNISEEGGMIVMDICFQCPGWTMNYTIEVNKNLTEGVLTKAQVKEWLVSYGECEEKYII